MVDAYCMKFYLSVDKWSRKLQATANVMNEKFHRRPESLAVCVIGAVLTPAFFALLCLGFIGPGYFCVLMSLLAAFTLALYGFRRLLSIDLRSGKLTLARMEKVRDEVYATAGSQRELAVKLANIAEIIATNKLPQVVAYPTPLDKLYAIEEARASMRDSAVGILRTAGVDDQSILRTRMSFDKKIAGNMEGLLIKLVRWAAEAWMQAESERLHKIARVMLEQGSEWKSPELLAANADIQAHSVLWNETRAKCSDTELRARLRASGYSLLDLEKYMQSLGVWSDRAKDDLAQFAAVTKRIHLELTPELLGYSL